MEAVESAAAGPLVDVSRVSFNQLRALPDSVLARSLQRVRDEFAASGEPGAAAAQGAVRVPVAAFNSSFAPRR